MPLDFPSSPTNGQVYGNYYYNSARGAWNALLPAATPNFFTNATLNTSTLVDATATGSLMSTTPLTVVGLSGQTANLQEWKNSSGTVVAAVTPSGALTGYGANLMQSFVTTRVPLTVKGSSGQTANLQEWQNSSGTVQSYVDSAGNINFSGSGSFAQASTGRAIFVTNSASTIPLTVKAAASQIADIQQWQSSTGSVLSEINSAGELQVPRIGVGSVMPTTTMLQSTASAATNVPIVARGATSQSANLQEWQNTGGTVLSSIDSSGALNTTAITDSGFNRVLNPSGGVFTTGINVYTGAIRITLPVGWTSHMHKFNVSVFDYNNLKSFDVSIAGYNFTGGTWVNPTAYILGNQDVSVNYTVRFGYTAGGRACIYIGETNSSWNYPQIAVNNVLVGFSTSSSAWLSGWTVDFVTGFENITQTVSNTQISAGLVPIIPTSVSVNSGSASVSANGTINFSGGVTNLRVNGCFSSAYRYYRVMFEIEATSSGMDLMFQLINLGSGYTYGRIGTYSGPNFTQTFASGNAAAMMSRSNQGNGSGGWMDVINPAHAGTKRFLSQSVDSGFLLWLGSINGNGGSYSDFQIYSLQGGTLTNGSLKVYGYR
jgi:hypothetical protein